MTALKAISEAELIEIENRVRAITTAENVLRMRIDYLDRNEKPVPFTLEAQLNHIQQLNEDFRRLIEVVRSCKESR